MAVNSVGLLGGSFDPVHLAHIALARTALQELSLDQVQLIPASQPWQREALSASAEQRLAMLSLAVRNDPGLHVNPLEIQRGGTTYTFDTLLQLPKGPEYIWILGADQLANFCTWHKWADIAALVRLAVAQRPGSSTALPTPLQTVLNELNRPLLQLPFTPMPISASAIRERLARNEPVTGLLDPAVIQYIQTHQLYRASVS